MGVPDWVSTVLTWIATLTGLMMTFFILLQEGKGGGLAALGGTKAAGVEGVTNPIRRFTAYLAVVLFLLLVTLAVVHRPTQSRGAAVFGADAAKAPDTMTVTPKIDAPKADAPKTEEKKAEEKPAEAPKTEEKKTEAPKADEKKADAPATPAVEKKPEPAKAEEKK